MCKSLPRPIRNYARVHNASQAPSHHCYLDVDATAPPDQHHDTQHPVQTAWAQGAGSVPAAHENPEPTQMDLTDSKVYRTNSHHRLDWLVGTIDGT